MVPEAVEVYEPGLCAPTAASRIEM